MRNNPLAVAGAIIVAGFLAAVVITIVLTGAATETDANRFAQSFGIAVAMPTMLTIIALMMKGFDSSGYYAKREGSEMFWDYAFSTLGGGIVGIVVTGLLLQVTTASIILSPVVALLTFIVAFVIFILRAGAEWSQEIEE